jgi:hypothetical protein
VKRSPQRKLKQQKKSFADFQLVVVSVRAVAAVAAPAAVAE